MKRGTLLAVLMACFLPAIGYCYFLGENAGEITLCDVDSVAGTYIPDDLQNVFNSLTDMGDEMTTADLRLRILAIGKVETGWNNTISKPNKNGSYDIGYLQLNSFNLKNAKFMEQFGPTFMEVYDRSNLTRIAFVTCIKYYKTLYSVYGEDAYYCYNAGEKRYLKGKVPPSTKSYVKKITKAFEDIVEEVKATADERVKREAAQAEFDEYFATMQNSMWIPVEEEEEEETPQLPFGFMIIKLVYKRPIDFMAVCKNLVCGYHVVNNEYVYIGLRKLKNGDGLVSVFKHVPSEKFIGFKTVSVKAKTTA